ncbi:hypothetical protein [Stenotrophomonas sp. AB1(2024)]|uniref:hypothetical protein n=1 Tax=Stenotrophomonas sp. AB1(2024) TaxID=3132215 RepID=UPI0030B197A2
MSEFNNRIDAQRKILEIVNSHRWAEELFGLSSGALKRWADINGVSSGAPLCIALNEAAGKLFFLANKSQEQVTDEYQLLAAEVEELTAAIVLLRNSLKTTRV